MHRKHPFRYIRISGNIRNIRNMLAAALRWANWDVSKPWNDALLTPLEVCQSFPAWWKPKGWGARSRSKDYVPHLPSNAVRFKGQSEPRKRRRMVIFTLFCCCKIEIDQDYYHLRRLGHSLSVCESGLILMFIVNSAAAGGNQCVCSHLELMSP